MLYYTSDNKPISCFVITMTSYVVQKLWRNIKYRWILLTKGQTWGKLFNFKSLSCYTLQLRLQDHATAHSIDGKCTMKHIAVLVMNTRWIDDHTSWNTQQYNNHACRLLTIASVQGNRFMTDFPSATEFCQLTEQTQSRRYLNGLVQDCSNSSALAMELLQSCTEPMTFMFKIQN